MTNTINLEVVNDNATMNLLDGEIITVDLNKQPRGNGQELGVFRLNGEPFISRFTKFGKQILFLQKGKPIRTAYVDSVEIIGTVVEGTKKAPAVTGANQYA